MLHRDGDIPRQAHSRLGFPVTRLVRNHDPSPSVRRAVAVNLEAMCNTFWYNVACQEEVIWLRLQIFMLESSRI